MLENLSINIWNFYSKYLLNNRLIYDWNTLSLHNFFFHLQNSQQWVFEEFLIRTKPTWDETCDQINIGKIALVFDFDK